MSLIIKNGDGKSIIKISEYIIQIPLIDQVMQPYGGHWIKRADEPACGEGFFCPADKLVKLLNDFYNHEFLT